MFSEVLYAIGIVISLSSVIIAYLVFRIRATHAKEIKRQICCNSFNGGKALGYLVAITQLFPSSDQVKIAKLTSDKVFDIRENLSGLRIENDFRFDLEEMFGPKRIEMLMDFFRKIKTKIKVKHGERAALHFLVGYDIVQFEMAMAALALRTEKIVTLSEIVAFINLAKLSLKKNVKKLDLPKSFNRLEKDIEKWIKTLSRPTIPQETFHHISTEVTKWIETLDAHLSGL